MAAKKSKRSILPIVIVIVIALAIIGSLGGHGDNEPDNQNTTQSDATSTETQADEKQTETNQEEGFDFANYGAADSRADEKALEALKSSGLEYGGQHIPFDGIVRIEGKHNTSRVEADKKATNGITFWVTFELEDDTDKVEIITNAALQAAALQKATDNAVILQVKAPNPDKPGYVVDVASISYDVLHPGPDAPADIKTMLASSAWWTLGDKSSAEGDSIDDLGL